MKDQEYTLGFMTKEELQAEIKKHWEAYKSQDDALAEAMANDASDDDINDIIADIWIDFTDSYLTPDIELYT